MRVLAGLLLAACVAIAIAYGACWRGSASEDAGTRGAASAPRTTRADAELEAGAAAPIDRAPSELDRETLASAAARRASVASDEPLRGRLLAPESMALPERTRVVAIIDRGEEWESFLSQRAAGERLTLEVGADGAFAFAWPPDADRLTLYADAPTLADVALAVVHRVAPGAYEFALVDRVTGTWIAPTLAPQQRRAYAQEPFDVQTQPALVLLGRLSDEPLLGDLPLGAGMAKVIVRAWLTEQLDWSCPVSPGNSFRFEHVPLGGDISVRIEGPYFWMDPLSVADPRPGETRDLGVLGERRYALRGRLVDARGAPVAAGGLRAFEIGSNGFPIHLDWSSTDEEGRFLLQRVPPRAVQVRAGRALPEYGSAGLTTAIDVSRDEVLSGAELLVQLAPSVRLAGLVLRPDGSTSNATRLRIPTGAWTGRGWSNDSRLGAATDEHGRFAFAEAPLDEFELCAWEDREQFGEPNLVARVTVGRGTEELVVRLAPIAPLRGRVVTAGGSAWNERWFLATSSDNVDWWGGTFDTSEFAYSRLWPGHWWIEARSESGLRSKTIEIEVPADLAREHVFVLQP